MAGEVLQLGEGHGTAAAPAMRSSSLPPNVGHLLDLWFICWSVPAHRKRKMTRAGQGRSERARAAELAAAGGRARDRRIRRGKLLRSPTCARTRAGSEQAVAGGKRGLQRSDGRLLHLGARDEAVASPGDGAPVSWLKRGDFCKIAITETAQVTSSAAAVDNDQRKRCGPIDKPSQLNLRSTSAGVAVIHLEKNA
ncbi:hypothetical protein EJB05_56284, partial [Eragrostis curvula]